MGQLFDMKEKIYKIIADKGLDQVKTSGQIGLKAGILLPFIKAETPDDDSKINNLKKATAEILGISI
jgi:hypothetical protein